jgi:hypothetical protein
MYKPKGKGILPFLLLWEKPKKEMRLKVKFRGQPKRRTILELAMLYLAKGFSLIPLRPKDKKPAIASWKEFQDRKPSEAELKIWFADGTQNNLGIVTGKVSGIVVVDFDSQEAIEFAERNNFPDTPSVATGKGFHAYYRYKEGVRNFQKRDDLPQIDLRGDGGYVVAPPSIHPSGKQYQWVNGKGLDDLSLAELPEIIIAQKPEEKVPLKDLYQGVDKGSRNGSLTRLVGSWVNDHLSFQECLKMAFQWNEINLPPETDRREIEQTVKSIFDMHHRFKATEKRVDMTLIPLSELLKEPEETVTWLVEGVLPMGGFSVLASKPKVGKSTIARNLAKCVARGESFLGRKTNKGPVIYLALEEKRAEVKRHFEDMGATGEEEIFIYAGGAPVDALIQIREIAERMHPSLIIIDPLFRMTRVKDGNDYVAVTQALEPILRLARDTGAHVLCVHHTGKGDRQGGDSVLGSTAIFSSVDTLMLMSRHEHYRTIHTIQRYGEDMEETTLHYNKETRTIEIGESKEREDISTLKTSIQEFLSSQSEPKTETEITNEVEGRNALKRTALRELVKEEKVNRDCKGSRGDPYKYSCTLVPEHIWVQGYKSSGTHDHSLNACSQLTAGRKGNEHALDSQNPDTRRPLSRRFKVENVSGRIRIVRIK